MLICATQPKQTRSLATLTQRQYSDRPPWVLSGRLRRGLKFLKQLEQLAPPREVHLWKPLLKPLVVASDGRVDEQATPSAAVLVADPEDGTRVVIAMQLCEELVFDVFEQDQDAVPQRGRKRRRLAVKTPAEMARGYKRRSKTLNDVF